MLCLLTGAALATSAHAQDEEQQIAEQLEVIQKERELLTTELEQYDTTLKLLTGGQSTRNSTDPAVFKLSQEIVQAKLRLIRITEREVKLLQQKIAIAQAKAEQDAALSSADARARAERSRRLQLRREEEMVSRLLSLLARYYQELEETLKNLPSGEEMIQLDAVARDQARLAKVPMSSEKVRLTADEGLEYLALISDRLADDSLPDSRRDIAPICSLRTRLFGKLISSEKRSLKPVGKSHYMARIRLQPGQTEIRAKGVTWRVSLPEDLSAGDFILALHAPAFADPELHIVSVDDLLDTASSQLPHWLPAELKLNVNEQ